MDCHAIADTMMRGIRGTTRKLPVILSAAGSSILKWQVHASLVVHPNMGAQTCGGISMERGFPTVCSTMRRKKRHNARSY